MYKVDYNGKGIILSLDCSRELEKVCIGLARNADGNWRNNHFHLEIREEDGVILTSAHGLGKVYRVNEIPFSDILDKGNREKYVFYRALYNMIELMNKQGLTPDAIVIKFECGKIVSVKAEDYR